MRLIMIFAPAFFEWPKAICQALAAQNPDVEIEIIALATTSRIRDQVQDLHDSGACSFIGIECFEKEAETWLAGGYNEAHLKALEQEYGSDLLNEILIADRHVGQGFITCADDVDSLLKLQTQDHDQKRAYIAGCAQFVTDLCDQYSPDAAFFYAVADANSAALSTIAKARGIKILRLTHTRIDNQYMLDESVYGVFDNLAKKQELEPATHYQEQAKLWLKNFKSGHSSAPDYMKFLQEKSQLNLSVYGIVKNISHAMARWLLYPFVHGKKPITTETGWQRVKESLVIPFKTFLSYWFLRRTDLKERLARPYIYYTLHVDPEASTMHLAPDHTNQLAVIEALAKRKPLHMDLLVKEHPNMVGRRPIGFYRAIAKMPSVYFVPTSVPSGVLIKHAVMVATITGTVAWEALLHKKPALVMGMSPYTECAALKAGLVQHGDLSTVSGAIKKALALKPLPDKVLEDFLARVFAQSFPLDTKAFWSQNQIVDTKTLESLLNKLLQKLYV